MFTRPERPDLAHTHHQHAQLHDYHAQAHHQQAEYHRQQARFHQEQAHAHRTHATMMGGARQPQFFANQPPYDERHTAFNNYVSPAALVFHGEISPQAVQSLQEFHNPYMAQNPTAPLSTHAAHATENQNALQRGHKF